MNSYAKGFLTATFYHLFVEGETQVLASCSSKTITATVSFSSSFKFLPALRKLIKKQLPLLGHQLSDEE